MASDKKTRTKDTVPETPEAPGYRDYSIDGPKKPPSVAKMAASTGKMKPFQEVATIQGQLVQVTVDAGALVIRLAYPHGDVTTLASWADALNHDVEITMRKKP